MQRVGTSAGDSPNLGVTLIELIIAISIMSIVMGVLFGLAISVGDTSRVQEEKMDAFDQARKGILYAARDLRQARGFGISELPADTVTYRVATDLDGNGSAVDVSGNIELSVERTITRDFDDLNGDGIGESQLVLSNGNTVMVLANNLLPDEDINQNGELEPEEDLNGNGVLDRGVWFERVGSAVRVQVQAFGQSRQGHVLSTSMSTMVVPRN
ncbi:MAG: prepilin-type N-terminal cleavage/methylation domain-containing protein [Nitrospiraceae bacterium]|nr:prepilin-type N-terminal cleavage/methylation domain-containing protein [Nitrospiraceae bacterium]